LANSKDTVFTGEVTAVALGNEEAYQIAVLLGVRKKRVESPEIIARNQENLANSRKVT